MKRLFLTAIVLSFGLMSIAQDAPTSHYESLRAISFEDYTPLRAKLYVDGVLQTNNRYEIGVYCGQQVRGCALPNDNRDATVYNIAMFGQAGDQFTFRLYDHENGMEAALATCSSFVTSNDAGYSLLTPMNLEFFTARTMTFTNVSGNNWSTLANWNGATSLPTNHDRVIINGNCVVDAAATANSVQVLTGKSLVLQAALTTTETCVNDGGQLRFAENGTLAGVFSMRKDIRAYDGENDNYYLVSSPLLESTFDPTLMRAQMRKKEFGDNNYDLYAFDESQKDFEWQNFRATPFAMTQGEGYLFEYEDGTTIVFMGAPNTAATKTMELDATSGYYGYNLVGNPFPCNAVVTSNKTNTSFARLNDNHNGFTIIHDETIVVPPCSAIFVRAKANDATVTFTVAE